MLSPSTRELRTGKVLSASTTAFRMKGMKVSRTPLVSSQAARCFRRSSSTRVMSTSKTVETWAEVRFERIMCSAVFLRMGVMGTTSTRSPDAGEGRDGAGAPGDAGAEGAGGSAAATRTPAPARCGRGCPAW